MATLYPKYVEFVMDTITHNDINITDNLMLSSVPDWVFPSMGINDNAKMEDISDMCKLIPNLNKFTEGWEIGLREDDLILRQILYIPTDQVIAIKKSLHYILSGLADPYTGIRHFHGYEPELRGMHDLALFSLILNKSDIIDVLLCEVATESLDPRKDNKMVLTYSLDISCDKLIDKFYRDLSSKKE